MVIRNRCVKFVRYFSVDKGSYSEEDLGKIVESNAIRMGKQLLILFGGTR